MSATTLPSLGNTHPAPVNFDSSQVMMHHPQMTIENSKSEVSLQNSLGQDQAIEEALQLRGGCGVCECLIRCMTCNFCGTGRGSKEAMQDKVGNAAILAVSAL